MLLVIWLFLNQWDYLLNFNAVGNRILVAQWSALASLGSFLSSFKIYHLRSPNCPLKVELKHKLHFLWLFLLGLCTFILFGVENAVVFELYLTQLHNFMKKSLQISYFPSTLINAWIWLKACLTLALH
jgi:hypothetical protein